MLGVLLYEAPQVELVLPGPLDVGIGSDVGSADAHVVIARQVAEIIDIDMFVEIGHPDSLGDTLPNRIHHVHEATIAAGHAILGRGESLAVELPLPIGCEVVAVNTVCERVLRRVQCCRGQQTDSTIRAIGRILV